MYLPRTHDRHAVLTTLSILLTTFQTSEAAVNFTSTPIDPTIVIQGTQNLHLRWNFSVINATLDNEIRFSKGTTSIGYLSQSPRTKFIFSDFASSYDINTTEPATFIIKEVTTDDAARYSCQINDLGGHQVSSSVLVKVLVPPAISYHSNVTVNETYDVQLSCTSTGNPNPNITWTRHGQVVGTGNSLAIRGAGKASSGWYSCTADNGVEPRESAQVFLDVYYKPVNVTVKASTVCQNNSVNLTCQASANPPVNSYTYIVNGRLPITSPNQRFVIHASSPGSLFVTCIPSNILGSGENVSTQIIIKATPVIMMPPISQMATEGQNMSLFCNASGTKPLNITWIKNDYQIITIGQNLSIHAIRRQDEGIYTCFVNNGNECPSTNASARIDVVYKPSSTSLVTLSNKTTSCLGDKLTFNCTTVAKPAAEYTLYRNNQLYNQSAHGIFHVKLSSAEENTFTCVPNNTVGIGQNSSYQILVKERPVIVTRPTSLTLTEGGSLYLYCNASGFPVPNITWIKLGASHVYHGPSLDITSIRRSDEGVYRCIASNGNECKDTSAEFNVTVNYKPQNTWLSSVSNTRTACLGEQIHFNCTTVAKPAATLKLYRNGHYQSIRTNGQFNVQLNVTGENNFSCVANNSEGTETTGGYMIFVKGPPILLDHPASLSGEEGDSVALTCNASGTPEPNITWIKVGIGHVYQGEILRFPSLKRSDDGVYRCTARNGDECNITSAAANITLRYKPENTRLVHTIGATACANDSITLSCTTSANPPADNFLFYRNDQLIGRTGSGTYVFKLSAAGDNVYKCEPQNTIGRGTNATVNITVKDPPAIVNTLVNQTVREGSRLSLTCNGSGTEPLNVTWTRVRDMHRSTGHVYTIGAVRRTEEGLYRCTVYNGEECLSKSTTTYITVNYEPEHVNLTAFLQGDSVALSCRSRSKPTQCNVTFYRNDVILANYSSQTCADGEATNHVISNRQGCTNQTFSCEVNNHVGTIQRSSVTIVAKVPPTVNLSVPNSTITLAEGETLNLNCTATGCPTPSMQWAKDGLSVASGQGPILTHVIIRVEKSDEGQYQCSADNAVVGSPVLKSIRVDVTSFTVVVEPRLTSVQENAMVNLSCSISGVSALNVTWTDKNGNALGHERSLVFAANNKNGGLFTCSASNAVGRTANATATVIVQSPVYIIFGSVTFPEEEFDEALLDKTSAIFDIKAKRFKILLEKPFRDYGLKSGVQSLTIIGFRRGSTIVDFKLMMTAYIEDPLLPLKLQAARNGSYIDGTRLGSIQSYPLSLPEVYDIKLGVNSFTVYWKYHRAPQVAQCWTYARKVRGSSDQKSCTTTGVSTNLSCSVDGLESGSLYVLQVLSRNSFGFKNTTAYASTIDIVSCQDEKEVERITIAFAVAGGILLLIIVVLLVYVVSSCKKDRTHVYSLRKAAERRNGSNTRSHEYWEDRRRQWELHYNEAVELS